MASGSDPLLEVYATPTKAAKQGSIALQQLATFGQRVLTVRAGGTELHPRYEPYGISTKLAGEHNLPLVWAGGGTPEDFAKIDVRNKAALVGVTVPAKAENPLFEAVLAANAAAANAAKAGATTVVSFVDVPGAGALGLLYGGVPSDAIAHLSLSQAEGVGLRDRIGGGGAVTLELSG